MEIHKAFYDLCVPYNKNHTELSRILAEMFDCMFIIAFFYLPLKIIPPPIQNRRIPYSCHRSDIWPQRRSHQIEWHYSGSRWSDCIQNGIQEQIDHSQSSHHYLYRAGHCSCYGLFWFFSKWCLEINIHTHTEQFAEFKKVQFGCWFTEKSGRLSSLLLHICGRYNNTHHRWRCGQPTNKCRP